MKVRIVVAFLLLATITGCKSKSAFDYSEKIVKMEKDLDPYIQDADERMSKFLESQTYDSVAVIATRLEGLLDAKLTEIKNTDPPKVKEADNFKHAAIRWFSFLKNLYTIYKSFASQTNEEDREKERKKLLEHASKAETAIKEMQNAQKEYAAANNFKIKTE